MPKWVNELLERDRPNEAKRLSIASNNLPIWNALLDEIRSCVTPYNTAHGPELGWPAVALSVDGADSVTHRLKVAKQKAPEGMVEVEFPFNECRLMVRQMPGNDSKEYTLDIDIPQGTGHTVLEGLLIVRGEERLRIPEFVECLLRPLLFPQYS